MEKKEIIKQFNVFKKEKLTFVDCEDKDYANEDFEERFNVWIMSLNFKRDIRHFIPHDYPLSLDNEEIVYFWSRIEKKTLFPTYDYPFNHAIIPLDEHYEKGDDKSIYHYTFRMRKMKYKFCINIFSRYVENSLYQWSDSQGWIFVKRDEIKGWASSNKSINNYRSEIQEFIYKFNFA